MELDMQLRWTPIAAFPYRCPQATHGGCMRNMNATPTAGLFKQVGYGILLGAIACLSACGSDTTSADTTSDTIVDTAGDVDSETAETVDDTAQDSVVETDTTFVDTTRPEAQVVINEVSMNGDDWVEFYNAGDTTADIGGWLMRDSDPTHAFLFPADTLLPAGVYLLVERNADGFDFGLGGADSVLLFDGDTTVDSTTWTDGAVADGFTWGRFPNGSGTFDVLFEPTPGAANRENVAVSCPDGIKGPTEACDGEDFGGESCEARGFGGGTLGCEADCAGIDYANCTDRVPGLVINELTSKGGDEIELYNGSDADIDVSAYVLSDAADNRYELPASTVITAGSYLVIDKDTHMVGLGGHDRVTLTDAAQTVVDSIGWPTDGADPSWCRRPNGTGGFETCEALSLGSANP
ncbi:MAG: hypothetical protein ACI9MR_001620 [Myxococcota bacterium]|jgi:hypothetical protein